MLREDQELITEVGRRINLDPISLATILEEFDSYPRDYHSSDHIVDLFKRILKGYHGKDEEKLLLITALFHDYVYDPKAQDNEAKSAEMFARCSMMVDLTGYGSVGTRMNFDLVYGAIVDTKDHIPRTAFSEKFCYYDLAGFGEDNDTILVNEHKIRREYAWVDWDVYKVGKLEFLKKYRENPIARQHKAIQGGMDWLAKYIEKEKAPNIGIYAGSFNPFHVGHLNILGKAAKIFDKVVVAYGINPDKPFTDTNIPEALKYRQVDVYSTSIIEYLRSKSYNPTLIRGLRNTTDLQAELTQLRWMQEITDVKAVSIICDKEFDHISSSGIRAVENFPDLARLADSYKVK